VLFQKEMRARLAVRASWCHSGRCHPEPRWAFS